MGADRRDRQPGDPVPNDGAADAHACVARNCRGDARAARARSRS